jgi:MFS family permease
MATDRVGARRVILIGLVIAGTTAAIVGFVLPSAAATLACLALFDAGLFAAQVANQSTVLAIDPVAPARFNSTYMLVYFVGGSLGTARRRGRRMVRLACDNGDHHSRHHDRRGDHTGILRAG